MGMIEWIAYVWIEDPSVDCSIGMPIRHSIYQNNSANDEDSMRTQ
jgi:hypothetical protein